MGTLSFIQTSTGHYTITVGGTVVVGETYTVTSDLGYLSQYTSIAGDGVNQVATGLYNSTLPFQRVDVVTDHYRVNLATGIVVSATVTTLPPPPPPPPPVVTPSTATSGSSFGQIYQGTFDPVKENPISPVYTIKIFKKGYAGWTSEIKCSTIPVIHSYQTDEPRAGIKGSSLTINLLNEGTLPLISFYSAEDDTFRVQLFWFTQMIFDGYLVQDDCHEVLVDYTHEIQLSATDNLGLLKDIPFNKSSVNFSLVFNDNNVLSTTAPHKITMGSIYANGIRVGDQIKITGSTPVDGLYNITAVTIVGGNVEFTVAETIGTLAQQTTPFSVYRSNVYEKKTLANIIKACLLSTDIELNTHVYCNLRETTQSNTRSFLEQTLVTAETFMKNDTDWESCYDVLNIIMERFNLTLFQANGVWNIVRWDELRYSGSLFFTGYNIPGFKYDKDFNYVSTVNTGLGFVCGKDQTTYPEFGYLNRIFRSYKSDKETFNYKQPNQLLKNANLTILGTLLRQYTTGTLGNPNYRKYYEYTAPWWEDGPGNTVPAEFFIRVVRSEIDTEIERYLVVKKGYIRGYKIEVNKNDVFDYSFSQQVLDGSITSVVITVILTDGITTKYLSVKNPGGGPTPVGAEFGWGNSPTKWKFEIKGTDWQTVGFGKTAAIPFDGLVYVYLDYSHGFAGPNIEIRYNDIKFEYTTFINESTRITGHTHFAYQYLNIKNKEDVEVFIDSAPKNSISGSLFLSSMVGLLQKRADRWTRGFSFTENRRLGDITTTEILYWRQRQRTILEGRLIELVQGSAHLSMLTAFTYLGMPGLNFIWGKMDIDYRNNSVSGTLWENHTDYDATNDIFTHDYLFDYIYAPL